MSEYIRTPRWVFVHPDLNQDDLAAYMALAYFADGGDRAYNPPQEDVMRMAEIGDPEVLESTLKHLEECGCIDVINERSATVYHLPADPLKAGAID